MRYRASEAPAPAVAAIALIDRRRRRGPPGGVVSFTAASIAIAVASPPMQSEPTPRFKPRARSAAIGLRRMRAPEAPIGWPSDAGAAVDAGVRRDLRRLLDHGRPAPARAISLC